MKETHRHGSRLARNTNIKVNATKSGRWVCSGKIDCENKIVRFSYFLFCLILIYKYLTYSKILINNILTFGQNEDYEGRNKDNKRSKYIKFEKRIIFHQVRFLPTFVSK